MELNEHTNMQLQLPEPYTVDSLNKLFECRYAPNDSCALRPKYGLHCSLWNWKVTVLSNYYK